MYQTRLKCALAIIFLLITQLLFSQQTVHDYSANWKKADGLEKKGLTRSAKEEVLKIFSLAVKDKEEAQQVKAAIYLIRYRNLVEEDNNENNILYVDTLIRNAKAPVKNILQSIQAGMFWQYLQNNRYKFYNRTQMTEEKGKDITTWSIEKLYVTITGLYKASLQNESLLKTTRLEDFDPIIIKGINTRPLRPTLFDLLAHRALSYFTNDEKDVSRPAYAFSINEEKAFAPTRQFINFSFKTKDTASLYHTAILLLQDILKFHLTDADPAALIDADLFRLNFMNEKSVLGNKEKLYEAALLQIGNNYPDVAAAAQASFLRAGIYFSRGERYDPFTNKENQYDIKNAKEICDAVIKNFPASEGAINASNLLQTILRSSVHLETESVNIIGQPFRSLVSYKNTPKLYLRIIRTTSADITNLQKKSTDQQWADIVNLSAQKEWNIDLPDLQDYQQHSVEIKTEGLSGGIYYLVASKDPGFSLKKNILARQLLYVSNISYLHNDNDYYVLDRDSGEPLAGSKVQLWENKYDNNNGHYNLIKAEQFTADANGHFKIKDQKNYRSVSLQVTNNKDELFINEEQPLYNTYDNENTPTHHSVIFLFTDRSIYRPGQTIFFKGIVIRSNPNNNKSEIVTDFKTNIQLRDANNQKIKEIAVSSNEFGSFNSSFVLPQGLLNGRFTLSDSLTGSSESFNVEEYKRPKFFAEIQQPKGTYRVNDNIKVTGTAKAYAGNNIDGASVKYRVLRKVQYPVWWGYWGFVRKGNSQQRLAYGGNHADQEITSGETTTDTNGDFNISFKAMPDETVDKKDQPTFYYEVSADVTDLNGETRSGTTSIPVSYQALKLDITIAAKLPVDSFTQIKITSFNTNGKEERTTATLIIEKLKGPGRIFRKRYWDQPDQFIMSKQEYYSYFPYDVYKDEDEVSKYPVEVPKGEYTDSTNSTLQIQPINYTAGWYKLTAITKDKYGEEARVEKYIELTDDKHQSADKAIDITVDKTTLQPGDKLKYSIATGFDKAWLIHTHDFMGKKKITDYQNIIGQKTFEIPVTETDRGGISMNIAFVKHNRFYSAEQSFAVPWSNKELNITYHTFRDKILPGAKEKWDLTVSGSKGEKVAAEMLVAMYDASLDQFSPHNWNSLEAIWPSLVTHENMVQDNFTSVESEEKIIDDYNNLFYPKSYDALLSEGSQAIRRGRFKNANTVAYKISTAAVPRALLDETVVTQNKFAPMLIDKDSDGIKDKSETKEKNNIIQGDQPTQVRKNFNETAFFFPDLKTDAAGNVSFSFTIPEALTKWKLMTMTHTKELASGYAEKTTITQKDLMVQPNAPRFLREGDRMEFSAKIVNVTDKEISGQATLELLDAASNQQVDGLFKNIFPAQYFTAGAGQSIAVKFPIDIPSNFNSALTYRIIAQAGNVSDGEEAVLPVLTNRMLVTESLPINMRNTDHKNFTFDKLLNSGNSSSLSHHALTVEYSSNPAWYAVQALPYLMEYPYECAEQTFNRYYANAIAGYISNAVPAIKAVFEKWKITDSSALLSNLQKNEELKSALLQETPWVMDAQNESQQKKNIALLFDMVKMGGEMTKALNTLKDMQLGNGGFVWFKGGPDDAYITQYIITGIGHLRKLNALSSAAYQQLKPMIDIAIPYLDKKIKAAYDQLTRYKIKLSGNNLNATAVQYLYMRSFFPEYPIDNATATAVNYYKNQAKKYWLSQSKYMQGMIALALFRDKDATTPAAIIKSLKENSIVKEELGMYWKEFNTGGYYWYQSPIESQSMMIEAFSDIDNKTATVDDLKTWLLKNKQTNNWGTTKATAEACYALLLNGSTWVKEEKEVVIQLGNSIIKSTDQPTEAGTGYFKKIIEADKVNPGMGNITVAIKSLNNTTTKGSTSWGTVYWQYFEDLDKITQAATPLQLTKHLFKETNGDKGPVLTAINDADEIKAGDKIKVRILLKVDRDMEYVHLKDMRAACMEPANVLSGYKYQDGLGYYESTKDASTNFFFSRLTRGTYVFEYPMFVTHSGNFSNGISTIQCMYAPEFTAHSEGIRVAVADR